MPVRRIAVQVVACVAAWVMLATSAGCAIPAIIGGMARSAQETGSTVFPAEYDGLRDETWAVVCFADRGITSEVFNVQTIVTNATTGKLVQAQVEGTLGSAGFQQGQNVLLLQTAEPAFDAWTYGKMAEELGVSRLVIVDIDHFQLYEPGNQYVWNGRVTARVGVVEADGMADSFAFSRDIDIIYPDGKGYTSTDFSRGHVVNVLLERLTNRVAWLFFEHEEPNAIEY